MNQSRPSIFAQYATNLLVSDTQKQTPLPLIDHPSIPLIINTLGRQHGHHILLNSHASQKLPDVIIESLAHYLSNSPIPNILHDAYFIYFDVMQFALNADQSDDIELDFQALHDEVQEKNKRIILVINQIEPLLNAEEYTPCDFLYHSIKSILVDEQWRLIVLTNNKSNLPQPELDRFFTTIDLPEPSDAELVAVLTSLRADLESFHQVVIPEEAIPAAIAMANQYMPGISVLDKTYALLDGASVRAGMRELHDASGLQPVVTRMQLAQVVSSYTQIPLPYLQNTKSQADKLIDVLPRMVFGQDAAIQLISATLQNALIKLPKKHGTISNFLFAGPMGSGKALLANALADQLFGHKNALLRVVFDNSATCVSDLLATTDVSDSRAINLLAAIQATPYAIVMIEHIEKYSPTLLQALKDIFIQGYALTADLQKQYVTHTIFIMTTAVGAECMLSLYPIPADKNKQIDLVQFMLNDAVATVAPCAEPTWSLDEISKQLLLSLMQHFPPDLLHELVIVPFVPLDYLAIEKIVRSKLKMLEKRLDTQFGVELSYVPEVIKFLAHETFWQLSLTRSLDKILAQHLYACVAQEISSHLDNKHKLKKLLLQLHDNGQVLRCELVTLSEAMHYKI